MSETDTTAGWPTAQVPAIYHRRIGDVLVTALADGYLDAPLDVLSNIEPAEAERLLKSGFRPSPPRISVNCFLIRRGGRTALVDTGSADSMGPTLGRLPGMMERAGVGPGEVDTVLLTHIHPDHSNGLTSPAGERLFPEAQVVVGEADVRHWHDDAAMARANERQKLRYFEWARFQIAPYRDRLVPAVGEVFPGVTAVPLPGHTPGHGGYLVESGGESLLIWGDVCHVPDIQVPRPEVAMVFDNDPETAAATRRRTFDMVATDRILVAGMHLHFPGFAYLVGEPGAHSLIPEGWTFTL